MDEKYVVFKKAEFENGLPFGKMPDPLHDAVVIRRQDMFAPPALDAYANSIQCVVEMMNASGCGKEHMHSLQLTADYFHEQAAKAWTENRKIPD